MSETVKTSAMTPKPGEIWRDKDKRREKAGTVRKFEIVRVGEHLVVVNMHHPEGPEFDWQTHFRRSRFGSRRANDSFERVEE